MTPRSESMVKQLTDLYDGLLHLRIEPSTYTVTITQAQYERLLTEVEDSLTHPRPARERRYLGMKLEVL